MALPTLFYYDLRGAKGFDPLGPFGSKVPFSFFGKGGSVTPTVLISVPN